MQLKLPKRKHSEEPIITSPEPSLRDICSGDDELYNALEDFLLVASPSAKPSFGTVQGWFALADQEKAKGENLSAMVSNECAARVACFENDKETTKKALLLADALNPNPAHATIHKTLLSKLDKVFEIADAFYKRETEQEVPLVR